MLILIIEIIKRLHIANVLLNWCNKYWKKLLIFHIFSRVFLYCIGRLRELLARKWLQTQFFVPNESCLSSKTQTFELNFGNLVIRQIYAKLISDTLRAITHLWQCVPFNSFVFRVFLRVFRLQNSLQKNGPNFQIFYLWYSACSKKNLTQNFRVWRYCNFELSEYFWNFCEFRANN